MEVDEPYMDMSLLVTSQNPLVGGEANNTNGTQFRTPLYALVWISLTFLLVFVVGLLGNLLVIVVVTCVREMRTPTNVCLMNLSVADLLVLVICQPSALLELYAEERWMLGHFMCKLTVFMENMVCLASILIILSVSFERYYAVCYPLKMYSNESRTKASILMLVMWVVAAALTSPFLAITDTEERMHKVEKVNVTVCVNGPSEWFPIYIVARFVVIFVIPLLLLVFLYSRIIFKVAVDTMDSRQMTDRARVQAQRSRQQLVIMLVGVIVLFFLCLLPFQIVVFLTMFRGESFYSSMEVGFNVHNVSRLLIYINSAGNPIIYSLASTKFRRAFARVLHRLGCRCACLAPGGRGGGGTLLHSEENGTLRRATVTHYTSVRQDLSVCEGGGGRQSV